MNTERKLRALIAAFPSMLGLAVRTALLSRAERARGFAASSRSVGETGLATRSNVGSVGSTSAGRWREPAGVPPLRSRKKRLTMRSSRLWKVTTASGRRASARARPPRGPARARRARHSNGCGSPGRCGSRDRLFWPGRKPAARRTIAASSAVRSTGRAATMARAIAAGPRLLAIVLEDAGDLGLVGLVEEFGGGQPRLAHAHVERTVGLEGEAAVRPIELHRRDADIEGDGVDVPDATFSQTRSIWLKRSLISVRRGSGTSDRPSSIASGSRSKAITRPAPAASMARV